MTVVQYYKHPRTRHWRHEMIRLGEDAHGVWLGATRGTIVQRGDEEPISLTRAFVQLITPDRWWSAIFNHDHAIEVYVDVTTVAEWVSPDRVEMVDLDLDVIRRQDGTVYVADEDEFEEHRVTLGYPPRMADVARTTAARLVLDLEARRPPFDGSWSRWLAEVV
ncbi:MAG TPA: DUF402 domain-containing protein [Acidimicrobiia bacterium]|jgi:protein associated with RNAse G/E|nr:DUF402 domain-containing protein [Acidimicrobiia bacterium]